MTHKRHFDFVYAAACAPIAEGGGIYRYRIESDALVFVDCKPMDRPMYAALDGNVLYVVLRAEEGRDVYDSDGLFVRYALDDSGLIGDMIGTPVTSAGACPCHLSVADGASYLANYVSGSVARINRDGCVTAVTHEMDAAGPNAKRQDKPHPHCAILTQDGQHVLVCDLGLDAVVVYDRALHELSRASVPAGHGARHAVFSRDGKTLYVANELLATVSRFAYDGATLSYLDTVSCYNAGIINASVIVHGINFARRVEFHISLPAGSAAGQ